MRLTREHYDGFCHLLELYWSYADYRGEFERINMLPSYAWPGGYQIVYYLPECDMICPQCANALIEGYIAQLQDAFFQWAMGEDEYESSYTLYENIGDDLPFLSDIYYEGPDTECCDHRSPDCVGMIQATYGDPEEEERESDEV